MKTKAIKRTNRVLKRKGLDTSRSLDSHAETPNTFAAPPKPSSPRDHVRADELPDFPASEKQAFTSPYF